MNIKVKLTKKSIPVELEVADGQCMTYQVKEMSGAQRDEYQSRLAKKATVDAQGNVIEIKDTTGLYSSLLAHTLYDPDGKLVPEATIQSWPDSAQRALFEVAREVNGYNDKQDDPEKKD